MKVFYFLILMALDKKVQIKKTALQATWLTQTQKRKF